MVERVQFTAADAHAAQQAAKAYEGRATHNTGERSGLVTGKSAHELLQVREGKSYTYDAMTGEVTDKSVQTAYSSLARDGTVQLPNGMTVSEEVAITNGWVRREANGVLTLLDQDFLPQDQKKPQGQPQQQQKSAAETDPMQALYAETDKALDHLEANVPAQDREAIMTAVVEEADTSKLASIVGEKTVETMVASYSHWLDTTAGLGITGIGEIAVETLDPDELSALRSAVIRGDVWGAKHLAGKAVANLEAVDKAEGFLSDLEEQGAVVERRGDGSHKIILPDGTQGTLGSLVRIGKLKFG